MKTVLALPIALLAGCVTTSTSTEEVLQSTEVSAVFADSDRGDFTYRARVAREGRFDVTFVSQGSGASLAQAARREAGNTFGAAIDGPLLDLWARSERERASVDIDVQGPSLVSVESVLLDGTVRLSGVDGIHVVTANRVEAIDVIGDVDLYAGLSGLDAEVWPYEGGFLRLEAFGDLVLRVPYGLEYDLQALTDPAFGSEVTDLGFDYLVLDPGYVEARTGSGGIRIDVFVEDGTFFLWEHSATSPY